MSKVYKVGDVISPLPKSKHITFTSGENLRSIFKAFFDINHPLKSFSFCRHFNDGSRALLDSNPNESDILFYTNLDEEIYFYNDQYEKFNRVFLSHFTHYLAGKIKQRLEDHIKFININFSAQDIFYNIRKNHHYTDVFSFSMGSSSAESTTYILNAIEQINVFVDNFYLKAKDLINLACQQLLILPWREDKITSTVCTVPVLEKPNLSPQEMKISMQLIKGKTAKEIGHFCNLSYRTVEHYIENIKKKYDASKKSELIYLLCKERLSN